MILLVEVDSKEIFDKDPQKFLVQNTQVFLPNIWSMDPKHVTVEFQ